jgi:hypothetical protein
LKNYCGEHRRSDRSHCRPTRATEASPIDHEPSDIPDQLTTP